MTLMIIIISRSNCWCKFICFSKTHRMFDKIILVQVDSILGYPPTMALIKELVDAGTDVTVLTTVINSQLKEVLPNSVKFVKIGNDYTYSTSLINKFAELFRVRSNIWKYIDEHYNDDTLLWVMSNITIKHMGMKLLNYRYNLHLFELVEKVTYLGSFTLGLDLEKLANHAHNVIVCEYNRAQITQAWFKLKKLPLVISNKPMLNDFKRNSDITRCDDAKKIIDNLSGKKIILYQGVVDVERPIEPIAYAIEEMGDEFVFLVMTGSKCEFLKKYQKTIVMSYIPAPYHLEVTSHAFVGILIYTPVYGTFTSPLNSIYCAPNKIFEFSQFGIPMIGNDIPGLKYTIEFNKMGTCVSKMNTSSFSQAIKNITDNYKQYSENAMSFFANDNKTEIVRKALI